MLCVSWSGAVTAQAHLHHACYRLLGGTEDHAAALMELAGRGKST